MKNKKNLDYYLNLPWTYIIETVKEDEAIYYIIRVVELPGICTDCEDVYEGMNDIKDLIASAVEIYKEKGEVVPEPINKNLFKGNIAYRTNNYRHYLLAKASQLHNTSISKTIDKFVDIGLEAESIA